MQDSKYESNQNAYQLLAFKEKHQEGSISVYHAQG